MLTPVSFCTAHQCGRTQLRGKQGAQAAIRPHTVLQRQARKPLRHINKVLRSALRLINVLTCSVSKTKTSSCLLSDKLMWYCLKSLQKP